MNKNIFYTITIMAFVLASCQNKENVKKQNKTADLKKKETVKVLSLDYHKVNKTIDYTGTLLAFEELQLAPASPGKIEKINVEISDHVKKGKLLIEMDKTQLQQAEVQLNTLKSDMDRFDELKKTNSIAPQKYDQLKAQYEVAKNNVAFLQKNTFIKAPFSGVISAKYYENGEMFSGAPNPITGKATIVSLVQIDKLKILVSVSEKYYPIIKKGTMAEIKSDIFPNKNFKAKVFNIYPTIDPLSRTFNVEFMLDNKNEILRPGMFVKTSITLKETSILLLPDYAVLKMQGSNNRYLFVNNNGIAKRVAVKIGNRYDDKIEVLSDQLKKGDQIIVSGQSRIFNGDELEIVK